MTKFPFRYSFGALASMAMTGALAQPPTSYVCTSGGLERRIQVIYETGLLVPCEVHYVKDAESADAPQVLWRAANEEGYCEAKAAEFVQKLTDWGWQCASPTNESEPTEQSADDTEALTPSSDATDEPR